MLVHNLRVLCRDLIEDFVEETVGHLHDVVFGEAGDLFAVVLLRVLEGVAHDLFAAGARDQLDALDFIVGETILDSGVEILLVLAYDDHVHFFVPGLDERVIRNTGTDIGVETQCFARSDVQALESPALRRGDGGLQKNFGAAQ